MTPRGCLGALFFAPALWLALLSIGGTNDLAMLGMDWNNAPVVVVMCGLAVALGLAGYAALGWRSVVGAGMALLLAGVVATSLYIVVPMLHCWSYDTVAANDDGSYYCLNRDMSIR
ncbi:DUF4175 domain-containing protein [Streptomyces sp. TRM49041]|uniref:DUF4175 domain-containing protein n=1 Tax=Streptomyces sp. TRM49041 TaxID=2603216 RepID=UPI0011ED33AE|nr:DUF4175 domain-containing protein [Streptomyces sp. TRM49041]